MKPPPLVHLPTLVQMLVPIITVAVTRAVHGEPPLRKARLSRAMIHAQRLVSELQSAMLELEREDAS
jgi:hypothetical protein